MVLDTLKFKAIVLPVGVFTKILRLRLPRPILVLIARKGELLLVGRDSFLVLDLKNGDQYARLI